MQSGNDQPRRSWWGRHWKWVVPVGCLLPILICGGFFALIFSLVFGMMKSSDVYVQSLAAARSDAQLQAELGTPIEPGFLVTGNINISGSSGHADISYNVSGPKGSGTIYAVADKAAGQWTFQTLAAQLDAPRRRIDLLSAPTP